MYIYVYIYIYIYVYVYIYIYPLLTFINHYYIHYEPLLLLTATWKIQRQEQRKTRWPWHHGGLLKGGITGGMVEWWDGINRCGDLTII